MKFVRFKDKKKACTYFRQWLVLPDMCGSFFHIDQQETEVSLFVYSNGFTESHVRPADQREPCVNCCMGILQTRSC